MSDLWRKSASELAAGVADKTFSAAEVLDSHLDRIARVNAALNAVVRVTEKEARAAAAAVDEAVAKGNSPGPLAGVPVSIKENIDWVTSPTTQGLPALAEAVPASNSPVVDRVLAAGAVPIGRTNLPEMGLRLHTDNALHGATRNPWDASRTTGGSSGGEAVALATGMSALGLGNDIGGSLRNPANCCGIASIKPTQGVVPHAVTIPVEDEPISFQVMLAEGPMARRVADVRLGLDVLQGAHPRDPTSISARFPELDRPLRVAVMPRPPGGDTDGAVAAITESAADALSNAGCAVEHAHPEAFEETCDTWAALMGNDVGLMLPLLQPLLSADARAFIDDFLESLPSVDAESYARTLIHRGALSRRWAAFFDQYDVLLSPTWARLPFKVGWDIAEKGRGEETMRQARCVLPGNALGLPSACVPAGLADGLPVGVLLTGPRFSDYQCLDAAAMIEAAAGVDTPLNPC